MDEIITVTEMLYGKYDIFTLVDNDLSDCFEFLALKWEVYIETIMNEYGAKVTRHKVGFRGIKKSTLLHLRSFHVFDTTFTTLHCIKLLTSRMHEGSLWLDKEYPIHVDDIY